MSVAPGAPTPATLAAFADSYKTAFDESVRKLGAQDEEVAAIRTRAGVLLSVAGVAASFFGPTVIGHGDLDAFAWVAICGLFVVAIATVLVNWPRIVLATGADPSTIIAGYIEAADPLPIGGIHRELALALDHDYRANRALLRDLFVLYVLGAVAFLVEIAGWIVALGSA
jgi:hypothetical protein